MSKTANRLLEIDALRAIACTFIVFGHTAEELSQLPTAHPSAKTAHDFVWQSGFGNIAVVIFFAISGYGICSSMRGPRLQGSLDFIIRRFFRLYPVFWLSNLIAVLFVLLPNHIPLDWKLILANATMLPELLGHLPLIIVYWTLETELAFYLLCLMLFLLRGHNNIYMLVGTIVSLFAVFCYFLLNLDKAPSHLPWLGMPYHLAIAFWGALYRYCEDNNGQKIRVLAWQVNCWWIMATITLMLLFPALFKFGSYFINYSYWSLRLSLPYIVGIIGFLIFTKWLPVRSRFLAEMGNYTYSIYLFHHVLITYVILMLYPSYPGLFNLPVYIYFIAVFAFSALIGYVVYNQLEKRMMNFSKQLVKRL